MARYIIRACFSKRSHDLPAGNRMKGDERTFEQVLED